MAMQHTVPLLISTLTLGGCFLFDPIDPCTQDENGNFTNPLINDQVKQDCEACGQSPCPDDGGETSEDLPGSQELTCFVDGRPKATTVGQDCFVGHWEAGDFYGVAQQELEYKTADDCLTESDPHPCRRSWLNPRALPEKGPSECIVCNAWDDSPNPEAAEAVGAPDYDFAEDLDEMLIHNTAMTRVCATPSFNGSRVSRSAFYGPGDSPGLAFADYVTATWWKNQSCTAGEPFPSTDLDWLSPSNSCEHPVQILGDGYEHDPQDNMTCRCLTGDDWQCPAGTVCEADWQVVEGQGVFPHPTLCTWDDGSGTKNGPAPEGPIVYGLDVWEDGIAVETRRDVVAVRVTPAFLGSLIPAAWNDDQRFNTDTAELTYCGPNALCDWLGLVEGDRLRTSRLDVGLDLLSGHEVSLTVEHLDGATTTFAVSIDFDGDLTDD